jgi:signal transduction histidine kinase
VSTDTLVRTEPRPPGSSRWSHHEVQALLRVSEAVALSPGIDDVLAVIAEEARNVTAARAASIVLAVPNGPLRLAAAKGLSRDYRQFLANHFLTYTGTLSRTAVDLLEPVIVEDIQRDARFNRPEGRTWKRFTERSGYRAMVTVPLIAGRRASGALNIYRGTVGEWSDAEVELVALFGRHAASAIESAKLIDAQRRQVEALERLVGVLRDQTHEYANRLHALSGLLTLGQTREAQRFLAQLMSLHHENYASVVERVSHPMLAGLLLAQMSVARQRGVEVRLHRQTRLNALPSALGEAEAVTIVANLIENAVEAVAPLPEGRRRVTVRIGQSRTAVTITVRDWGPGIEPGAEPLVFARGETTKEGHAGIGLALVAEAIASSHGTITVRRFTEGVAFVVTLPRG